MGFFDNVPIPQPEPEPTTPAAVDSSEVTLGAAVAVESVLTRTDDVALALSGLTAHPGGFEFTLGVALRREDRRDRVFTHGFHHRVEPGEPLPDEFLRVGVGFADGDEFFYLYQAFRQPR